MERLLKDLALLEDRILLVIDDVHELGSDQAQRQLELRDLKNADSLTGLTDKFSSAQNRPYGGADLC